MKKRPLFNSDPYELTDYSRHVWRVRLKELEEQRVQLIDRFRLQREANLDDSTELAAAIKLLHQFDIDIERLESTLGHSAGLEVRNRLYKRTGL